MAYVYVHRKITDNEIFYVGIGIKPNHFRAKDVKGRNVLWNRVVRKYGFYYEIVADDLSWEEACEMERRLIGKYGRRNIKTGILVNMTDGGDGLIGLVVTEEHKSKISNTLLGHPVSASTRKILSDKLKVKMKGLREKTPIEWQNISKSKMGDKNWMFGRKGELAPFFKGFVHVYKEGEFVGEYAGIYDCAEKLDLSYKKISACLNGNKLNGEKKTHQGYTFQREVKSKAA